MRWRASLAVLAVGAAAFFAFSASPAGAATLANVSWTVTNNQVGATNVTYAYSFKTATAGTIAKITFVVSGTGPRRRHPGDQPELRDRRRHGDALRPDDHLHRHHSGGGCGRHPDLHRVQRADEQPDRRQLHDGHHHPDLRPRRRSTRRPRPPWRSPRTTPLSRVAVAKSLTFTSNTQAFELDMDPSLPALADQSATVALDAC